MSLPAVDPEVATAPLRAEYPRPQFVRSDWLNLNGSWEFEFDDENVGLEDRSTRRYVVWSGYSLFGRFFSSFSVAPSISPVGSRWGFPSALVMYPDHKLCFSFGS